MMKKKYKVGIWGQFGDGVHKIADGQAVRTTIMTKELKIRYGEENIGVCNTNNWKKRPISFFFKTAMLFFASERVAILPADGGFKIIVPLYHVLSKICKRDIYYVIIGGFLPALLKKNPKYLKMLKRHKAMFAQTENIKADLEAFGLDNVYILSNPKRLNTRREEELILNEDKRLSLCTFSRVSEDKGIDDAVDAVKLFNERHGDKLLTLDVFGMIDNAYREHFEKLLSENEGIVSYKGIVDYDKTVEALSSYFALIFPTYYHGEGFPGGMIDCFNTGIPVIATDWLYNKDVISDEVNGLLVPIKNPQAICDAIERLYNDRAFALEIAKNNLRETEKYHPDKVMSVFYEFMENDSLVKKEG